VRRRSTETRAPRDGNFSHLALLSPPETCLDSWVIEFLVRPPSFFSNSDFFRKNLVHSPLKRLDTFRRLYLFEESANERPVRLDETKESVRVLIIVATSDPEWEAFVSDPNDPTPVFSNGLLWFETLRSESIRNELSQALSVPSGVDLFVLAVISRKSVGPKFNVRLHEVGLMRSGPARTIAGQSAPFNFSHFPWWKYHVTEPCSTNASSMP
jgi:hypothetical protein